MSHEDGAVLFERLYQAANWWDVLLPYAGYVSVVPNVVAAFLVALPTSWVPTAFPLAATTIYCACVSVWFLPRFRRIIASDRVRFWSCFAVCAFPLGNAVLVHTVMYSSWSLVLAGTLLSVVPDPTKSRRADAALLVFLALAVVSTPVILVLVPLWVIKAARCESRHLRAGYAALVVLALVYQATVDVEGSGDDLGFEGGVHVFYALKEIIPAFSERVVFETLFTNWVRMHLNWWGFGWLPVSIGWATLAGAAYLFARQRRDDIEPVFALAGLLYVSAALTFLALATRFGPAGLSPQDFFHHRYFHVQQCIFLLSAVGIIAQANIIRLTPRILATSLCAYVVIASVLDKREFLSDPWPVGENDTADFIARLEACEQGTHSCVSPVNYKKNLEGYDWNIEISQSRHWATAPAE